MREEVPEVREPRFFTLGEEPSFTLSEEVGGFTVGATKWAQPLFGFAEFRGLAPRKFFNI